MEFDQSVILAAVEFIKARRLAMQQSLLEGCERDKRGSFGGALLDDLMSQAPGPCTNAVIANASVRGMDAETIRKEIQASVEKGLTTGGNPAPHGY